MRRDLNTKVKMLTSSIFQIKIQVTCQHGATMEIP